MNNIFINGNFYLYIDGVLYNKIETEEITEEILEYQLIDDEKTYNMLNNIEDIALKHNGIIYGEYVRAKILHNYNTTKFYEINDNIEKYWDYEYSPNTIDRFMKIKEMCINFDNFGDYINFTIKIKKIINDISFVSFEKTHINEFPKIVLNITFMLKEPLHDKVIFLCDGFIIKLVNNKKIFTYSANTGTPYDYIEGKTREIIESNIIKDIYKKKTVCISNYYSNEVLYQKIVEIINNGWKVVNLPYTIISSNENVSEIPELEKFKTTNCCVCLKELFTKNKNIEISILYEDVFKPSSVFYPIHHKCLLNYFEFQKNKDSFVCPYRYNVDYTICRSLTDFNYYRSVKLSVDN